MAALTDQLPETERWFVRRGVPHLIMDYSPSTRLWIRAKPFLIGVLVLEVMLPFSGRYTGASQGLVFLLSTMIMLVAVTVFGRLRGRKLFDAINEVEWPELAFFVLAPGAVVFVLDVSRWAPALRYAVGNLLLLGLVWLVVGFGLLPMIRWSVANVRHHLLVLSRLFARTLPVLLVLTVFMFINAEIWQVAYLVEPPAFAVVCSLVALAGLGFLWLSSDEVIDDIDELTSWDDVFGALGDSPLAGSQVPTTSFKSRTLTRGGRLNLRMLVLVSLTIQVVLVGLLLTAVYIGVGSILMNGDVVRAWTGGTQITELVAFSIGGLEILVTPEHLRVSGLVGALAGLNVAVSALTDTAYKETFMADLADEVRENLAVERLYRTLVVAGESKSNTENEGL